MAQHKIRKGLDLPLAGEPEQKIGDAAGVTKVAVMAADFIGMKPRMRVQVGDVVKRGQALFEDRKRPGVLHCAPGAGTVSAINRGARRALQSVVIDLSEGERSGSPDDSEFQTFDAYSARVPNTLSRDDVQALLVESGLWTALRARPYGRVALPGDVPSSVFVTAMATDPHAASVAIAMAGHESEFEDGLTALKHLTDGQVFLCKSVGGAPAAGASGAQVEEFDGPHPAGLVGTHIHMLDPVSRGKTVWHVNYADVIAIGALFGTGRLMVDRVVSLAGPVVNKPRLLRTRVGACIDELVDGELKAGENRVISGSVLSGLRAAGDVFGYLGRYHLQISALAEGREREFLGWLKPGPDKFTRLPIYLSFFMKGRKFPMTTTTHGSHRAMVPIGQYERVMPLDVLPTFLLRSLLSGDLERAEQLGALELSEEDLALCTVVDPGKHDFGAVLRKNLDVIEAEG